MAPLEELDETQILGALLGIGEMVGSLTETEEILEAIVRIAPGLVRGNRAVLMTYDEATREFRTAVAFGPSGSAQAFEGLVLADADAPRLAQRLVKQRLPVLLKDSTTEAVLPAPILQRLGVKSALIAPLVCRGRLLGALWLDSTAGHHYFTSKEINVVQGIATEAAIALDNGQNLRVAALEQRRFGALARALCDGVVISDAEGRILLVDSGAERLLGWTVSEIRGRRVSDVFDLSEGEASVAWTRDPTGPTPVSKDLELRAHDGARVACEVRMAVVRDDAGAVHELLYTLRKKPGSTGAEDRAVRALDQLAEVDPPGSRPE